jgi:hypothetical protein
MNETKHAGLFFLYILEVGRALGPNEGSTELLLGGKDCRTRGGKKRDVGAGFPVFGKIG